MIQVLRQLAQDLRNKQAKLVTAESCTGGWLAQVLTSEAGSSDYFDRGFVAYTNESKQDMLNVKAQTLNQFGAVSEETAMEMAEGALANSRADFSVSITGIAGPGGGSDLKPVGTVCFAVAGKSRPAKATTQHFTGDRTSVREQAVSFALKSVLEYQLEN